MPKTKTVSAAVIRKRRERWIANLLDTEMFPHGWGELCSNDKFCVMGVACETFLAARPRTKAAQRRGGSVGYNYGGRYADVPSPVLQYFGLTRELEGRLIRANDNDYAPVSVLARYIRELPVVRERLLYEHNCD